MKSLPIVHFGNYSKDASRCGHRLAKFRGPKDQLQYITLIGNGLLLGLKRSVCGVFFLVPQLQKKLFFARLLQMVALTFLLLGILSERNKDADVDWHRLGWFSPNVPRFGFVFWSVIDDKLPTVERINSWSVGSTRSLSFSVI